MTTTHPIQLSSPGPARTGLTSARGARPGPSTKLQQLGYEAKLMTQDVWQTVRTPRQSLATCRAEGGRMYETLSADAEYRGNILGRWFNQVGGGLSHGGFLALLGHTTAVSAAGGLLASTAITYFEDTVAGLAQVHRGILRDVSRQLTQAQRPGPDGLAPASAREESARIKSRAASRLILLGAMDAMVMGTALGVVWGVSAGLIGSGGLLLALAAMQTVRTGIVIYQFACLDILKVQIESEGVRDIINRKWVNAVNNTEQGLGRRIYQTTLIVCQTASFFTPPAYQLPFTAAQILVGMGLSAVGKLQFLPLIKVDNSAPEHRSRDD